MQTQEIVVRNQKRIDVEMKEDAVSIDEVVVVAFGTQKKESMVSSIETVKPAALKVPSSNLTTALAGRMSGLIAYQRTALFRCRQKKERKGRLRSVYAWRIHFHPIRRI